MCLKIFTIISLYLVLSSGKPSEVNQSSTRAVTETVYDINLYISIPAGVIALGLLLCLCYCVFGSCKDQNQHPITAFQPVVVTNRNSPVVVSGQSTSHTENNNGSDAGQQNKPNSQSTSQTGVRRSTGKKAKGRPPEIQKTGGQQSIQAVKVSENQCSDTQNDVKGLNSGNKDQIVGSGQTITTPDSSPKREVSSSPSQQKKTSPSSLSKTSPSSLSKTSSSGSSGQQSNDQPMDTRRPLTINYGKEISKESQTSSTTDTTNSKISSDSRVLGYSSPSSSSSGQTETNV